MITVIIAIVVM